MKVSFKTNGVTYSLLVQHKSLERKDPLIEADPSILASPHARANIGMSTFEDKQKYQQAQSLRRKRAWKSFARKGR